MSIPIINKPMTLGEWTLLITLALLWSGSFFFNELAVRDLPPFTVVLCRVGLGAVTLITVIKVMGHRVPTSFQTLRAFFFMGLINCAVPFSLIVWGQIELASGVASIFNASTPMFTAFLAHFFTTEDKLTPLRIVGLVCGFLGVTSMIGPEVLKGVGSDLLPSLAVIGAAFCYASGTIFIKRMGRLGIPPIVGATGQVSAATLLLLPAVLLIDQPWTLNMPGLPAIFSLLAIGIFSTGCAFIVFFKLLSTTGPTNLQLVTFMVPVGAITLGIMFLDEVLLPQHLIGMTLIGLGITFIDGRIMRYFKRSRTPVA